MNRTLRITISGVTIAIYIVFMYLTQAISFGQYQIRLATGLYALAFDFPFLCIPLGLANLLSNILFGGDIINGIFGFLAGTLTTLCICIVKKATHNKMLLVLPIAFIPSLLIPIWLSISLKIPYLMLVVSLLVGQIISAYSMGILTLYISNRIKKHLYN